MEIVDAVGFEQGDRSQTKQPHVTNDTAIPQDARFVISILNGERSPNHERRRFPRRAFVAAAELEVLGEAAPPRRTIYTRDANPWGVGYVTQHPLPVGRDATLRIWIAGEMLMLRSCILRCREVLPGWFEGAALLYNEEPRLEQRAR